MATFNNASTKQIFIAWLINHESWTNYCYWSPQGTPPLIQTPLSKRHVGVGFNMEQFGSIAALQHVMSIAGIQPNIVINLWNNVYQYPTNPSLIPATQKITNGQVVCLLNYSIQKTLDVCIQDIGESTWANLTDSQQVALADMAFIMGGLYKFPSMITAIQQGNWVQAQLEAKYANGIVNTTLSDWYKGAPVRAQRDIDLFTPGAIVPANVGTLSGTKKDNKDDGDVNKSCDKKDSFDWNPGGQLDHFTPNIPRYDFHGLIGELIDGEDPNFDLSDLGLDMDIGIITDFSDEDLGNDPYDDESAPNSPAEDNQDSHNNPSSQGDGVPGGSTIEYDAMMGGSWYHITIDRAGNQLIEKIDPPPSN